jgi:hypothetical protein
MRGLIFPQFRAACPGLYGGNATPPYTANGVVFDGATWAWVLGAMGASDTKVGSVSFWFWMKGGNATPQIFLQSTTGGQNRFTISRDSSNRIAFFARDASGSTALSYTTATADALTTSMTAYAHYCASWDLATGVVHSYLNGVSSVQGTPTTANLAIDYTGSQWSIGSANAGNTFFNGWIADFYLNFATAIDFSNATERQKFRSSGGAPVSLGANGSTPTGSQPRIFHSGDASTWHTNLGSGNGLTIQAGTITNAATDPP